MSMPVRKADCETDPSARRYGARLQTLRRRSDFQRLRGGTRWSGPGFLMEGKARSQGGPGAIGPIINGVRFGFTITKKLGKAHERNRMRRRLSHALRSVTVPDSLYDWDMVIVARPAALDMPFDDIVRDFKSALSRLARAAKTPTGPQAHGKTPARQGKSGNPGPEPET